MAKKMLSQSEKKEQEAKFLMELQRAQEHDLADAFPIAERLFGSNVDPLVIIAVSDRMFDKNGEIDEKKFADGVAQAKEIVAKKFGDAAANRPEVVLAVYDKVIDVDLDDDE